MEGIMDATVQNRKQIEPETENIPRREKVTQVTLKIMLKAACVIMPFVLIIGYIHTCSYPHNRVEWEIAEFKISTRDALLVYRRREILKNVCPDSVTSLLRAGWWTDKENTSSMLQNEETNSSIHREEKAHCEDGLSYLREIRLTSTIVRASVESTFSEGVSGIKVSLDLTDGRISPVTCFKLIARNQATGWRMYRNCSHCMIKGTSAVLLRAVEIATAGEYKATWREVTDHAWPFAESAHLSQLVWKLQKNHSFELNSDPVSHAQSSSPTVTGEKSLLTEIAGCDHPTQGGWFKWIVAAGTGTIVYPYPPGLNWLKSSKIPGKGIYDNVAYFMEVPIPGTLAEKEVMGEPGEKALDDLLTCVEKTLLESDWDDDKLDPYKDNRPGNIATDEIIPMCVHTKEDGIISRMCRYIYRNRMRRKRVRPNHLRKSWDQYAGLGFSNFESHLMTPCWAKAKTRTEVFVYQQFAAMYTGLQLSIQSDTRGLKVRLGDMHHSEVTVDDGTRAHEGYYGFWDTVNYTMPPPLILSRGKVGDCWQLELGLRNAISATGSHWGLYPGVTYGYYDKNYCTPGKQKWCYSYDYFPAKGRKEAHAALRDLAQIRTICTGPNGTSLIHRGSIKNGSPLRGECDRPDMSHYYRSRNPPPQRDGWMEMFWRDFPELRSSAEIDITHRWRPISGRAPDAYKALLRTGAEFRETDIAALSRWVPNKGRHFHNMWGEGMRKGFPHYTPPNEYLLGRWAFAATIFCNSREPKGENYGSVSQYDFIPPFSLDSPDLYKGLTLRSLWPESQMIDMERGNCSDEGIVRSDRSGFDRFKKTLSTAASDVWNGIRDTSVDVVNTVSSVVQGAWSIVKTVLKWAIPLLCAALTIAFLTLLGKLGVFAPCPPVFLLMRKRGRRDQDTASLV